MRLDAIIYFYLNYVPHLWPAIRNSEHNFLVAPVEVGETALSEGFSYTKVGKKGNSTTVS